jgi:hypothetical protein
MRRESLDNRVTTRNKMGGQVMKRYPLALLVPVLSIMSVAQSPDDKSWTRDFKVDPHEMSSTGRNPYFILEPGYFLVLEKGSERLTITVLDETRQIDGVETRVVEERETKNGHLVEISRNYFAINRRTNDVYYFGEDVDIYKAGKMVNHEGAWLAGVNGARFGLMMPGSPLARQKFYQEVAPGVAMDRAEIVALDETLVTPAGTFRQVLKVVETTPLETGSEAKYYARDVGLLQDGALKLVRYGNKSQK